MKTSTIFALNTLAFTIYSFLVYMSSKSLVKHSYLFEPNGLGMVIAIQGLCYIGASSNLFGVLAIGQ